MNMSYDYPYSLVLNLKMIEELNPCMQGIAMM